MNQQKLNQTYHDGLSELIELVHVLKNRRVTLFGNGWRYVYKPDLGVGGFLYTDGGENGRVGKSEVMV